MNEKKSIKKQQCFCQNILIHFYENIKTTFNHRNFLPVLLAHIESTHSKKGRHQARKFCL